MTDLTGKRVLILGAETDVGRAVATAVSEAGASVAAVAATSDAEAAFAVQRLARRLSSGERKVIAQAIDATNEAAVRVMVRQVSKELGGLDAVVFCEPPLQRPDPVGPLADQEVRDRMIREMNESLNVAAHKRLTISGHLFKFAGRELDRYDGGPIVMASEGSAMALMSEEGEPLPKWWLEEVSYRDKPTEKVVREVLRAIKSRGLWWKTAKLTPRPLMPVYRFLARVLIRDR